MTGIASTCGRVRKCGVESTIAASATAIAMLAGTRRATIQQSSAKVAAIAPAASTTGPVQPATL